MAYDETLARRIRTLVDADVTERAMFGGLAFLVGGHLAVAANSAGALMVRADPASDPEHLARDGVTSVVMRGRPMAGWLEVAPAALADDSSLGDWVAVGVDYAASLPPKEVQPPRRTRR